MTTWMLRRLIQAVVVMLAMTVIVFIGVNVIGDPIEILISPEADQAERARAVAALGLDKPLWEQYWKFLLGAVQGDLGRSFVFNEPALKLIAQRMPATLELALTAVLMSVVIGIPLGLYAGLKPSSLAGRTIMGVSILGFSLPSFWVGLMLIMVFAVQLGWLPSTGRGQTAELFGVQWSFLTANGLEIGGLIAFAVVTESVFAWPGMGKLIIDSINVLDRPVIVAYLMMIVLLFIVINLIVDLLYTVLDPRVRLETKE